MSMDPVKFLLVDDTPENLVALEALLRRDGLEILTARSGGEALEILLVHDIALAFVDVQMPEMDGFELAELMRGTQRTKHVPIIFVTAGSRDPQRIFKGYDSGAVDFLFKPIDPQVLKSKADVFFELHRQRKELANALRLNEMFVGILGHDLRNPLSAMQSGAHLLAQQITDERQLRALRRMISAGQRMTEMIEHVLDLTRARLGGGLGFARTRKRLDIAALVQSAAEELRIAHPARELRVEAAGDCSTLGDPGRLLQVFSNLIGNALHHGARESPVSVAVEGRESEVVIRVRNEGVIPAEMIPTLFDPFRSRQSGARTSGGLGLGLFISQQIAQAHEGCVAVESNDRIGTELTVRIPKNSTPRKQAVPSDSPRRILVVDDDDDIRDSLREILEEEGYRVDTASNGREAIEHLTPTASRPDLVILDLVLPVIDGHKVYMAMQADPALAQIPVVVSTANPALAPSGATVVSKVLNLDRLLDTVATLLRKDAARGAGEQRLG